MTNLEWLKNKAEEFNAPNSTGICMLCYKLKNQGNGCGVRNCNYCEFNDIEKCFDYLMQEHNEIIKLKQWEYDLMYGLEDSKFHDWDYLCYMKEKGYLKGITDTSMMIEDILKNCEIVSDDYEGFEDCK